MKRIPGAMSVALLGALLLACGSDAGPAPPPPPPCEQLCLDGIALRGLREGMKLIFNLTFQGKDVGTHDFTVPCPLGGTARISGEATSNAIQGTTEVKLEYVFDGCTQLERDDDADENYQLTVTGTVSQVGTIAVQPSSSTALGLRSDKVTITGTVYDPPRPYEVVDCPVVLSQNGNNLAGLLCGRQVGVNL
ncbi:MAG: hypothetical protein KF819_20860 [Labilithrix sp.]|nr:hypothetical protein [Labilithrix sp.]